MTNWGMTARKGTLRREVGMVSWAPLWVLAVLIVLSSPSIASTPVTPAILTAHAPIVIDGDDNFTAPNGVTTGTGGAADPYVIEGWRIDATSSNGITIRQTRAHLVIRNLTIEANFPNYWGIYFDFASNATVQNVSTRGKAGVYIRSSSNITVQDSAVDGQTGVALYSSSLITIKGNRIGKEEGINATAGDAVRIEGNDISYAGRGILLDGTNHTIVDNNTITWSGTYGLLVVASSSNLSLADNDISSNGWAGAIFQGATDGSIVRNRFSGNGHAVPGHGSGLVLQSSVRFQVDHNDFLSNEFQANDTQPGVNAWHAAYPRGGNHWSDYAGVDQCSGPAQNLCQGPDGFGDTPYPINGSAQDRYPLMHPVFDASPPTVGQVLAGDGYVGESITVSAEITDPSGVTYVALWLQGVGLDHFDAVPMRPQGGNLYRADIPPQNRPGTVLYHVVANDRWGNQVRDPSSGEYQVQVHSISEPIGGGPAGMDANAFGFLVAVPAGIFGALLLVAWALRARKH